MCGIAGKVWADGNRPGDATSVRTMCGAIRHRGPDDEGVWTAGAATIGMRRLSIIDLAGGHQPIFNETGHIGVVMNGEIYNYRELRAQLIARGHRLKTNSDTEVLVHLYEDHGERLVEFLRGMFAFAIWDAERELLLLGRDRFGIKPLYVAANNERIAFASELKALVAAGESTREIDAEAVDLFLQLGYIPAPRTPFSDVAKLPPAHTLRWERGQQPTLCCYWRVPSETVEQAGDVLHSVREALDDSVAAHLVSDVPIAAFLSGGIDSSAIVSSMAVLGYKSMAFTARYRGSGAEQADEVSLAAALCRKWNIPLTVVDVAPDLRDILAPMCRALDEPLADESAVPSWLLSQAVAASYKVVLAGTGGDELFGGYRRHRGLQLSNAWVRVPAALRAGASALAELLPEPSTGVLSVGRVKRFLRAGNTSTPQRYAQFVSRLSERDFAALRPAGDGARHEKLFAALVTVAEGESSLRTALRIDYNMYLPDDILAVSDRIASAHSLEVRVPFVDHVLVERLLPLADRYKIRGRTQKWVLREAVRERLTPQHFSAPKRGFVGPTALWLRNELQETIRDEFSSASFAGMGQFDVSTAIRLAEEHASGSANHEGVLWALLTFSVWHRELAA